MLENYINKVEDPKIKMILEKTFELVKQSDDPFWLDSEVIGQEANRGKVWENNEIEKLVKRWLEDGRTLQETASELGRSVAGCYMKLIKLEKIEEQYFTPGSELIQKNHSLYYQDRAQWADILTKITKPLLFEGKRIWQKEEEERLERYWSSGLSLGEIGERLQRTMRACLMRLERNQKITLSDEQIEAANLLIKNNQDLNSKNIEEWVILGSYFKDSDEIQEKKEIKLKR